jgi:hypothetical protein
MGQTCNGDSSRVALSGPQSPRARSSPINRGHAGNAHFIMRGLNDVAREASSEAKKSGESGNGIGRGCCRWRTARPGQPFARQAIHRQRTRQLLSMRKKSRTLACRLSMSSTMKTPEHIALAYDLPKNTPMEVAPRSQPRPRRLCSGRRRLWRLRKRRRAGWSVGLAIGY